MSVSPSSTMMVADRGRAPPPRSAPTSFRALTLRFGARADETAPVGWMRISALSNILIEMSKCFDGPAPTTSVNVEMPMPISSPRALLRLLPSRS